MRMNNLWGVVSRYRTRILLISSNKNGNVALLTALVLVPTIFAVGMGIDYSLALRRQGQINGYADAAALSAVTPAMMNQTTAVAKATATSVFTAQLNTVPSVTYSPTNIVVTPTDSYTSTNSNGSATTVTKNTRTVVVSYSALSANIFASVLGVKTIPISGTSSAISSLAPSIDFYLLLDTSPSMAIAATATDINTMVSNTSAQGGCAFGCHETNPAADNLKNPSNVLCTSGQTQFPIGGEDNFALARCLGVTLRIDLVNLATQNLMDYAQTTQTKNQTTYRAGIYTIDYNFGQISTLTANLAAAKTSAANIQALQVYDNSCVTITNCNNDEDSYLDMGLSSINTVMQTPGTGQAGNTPQEVLFIVSDGVVDEALNGSRVMAPINTKASWCDQIKSRGIRIAFLYLTYNPLPTNGFYNSNIKPFQSSIATAAQNCASSGLYYEVNTGGDISAAMTALFQTAVATSHLTQ